LVPLVLVPVPVVPVPVPVPGELLSGGVVAPPSLTGGLDRGEDGVEGGELAGVGWDVAAGPVV
jgi:hypothetical protein